MVKRRRLLAPVALAVLVVLIALLLLSRSPIISSHISPSSANSPVKARLHYGNDEFQFGDLRVPDGGGPHPVIVVIHGGFWRAQYDMEIITPVCEALTAQGMATWNIEYRRIGNPGGGWPGTFLDVAAATDYLRELAPKYNLDLNHVIVIGHSAGGHLAFWIAGRGRIPQGDPLYKEGPLPIKGAVSLAGVVDLRRGWEMRLSAGVVEDFMGGTPDAVPGRYATASPIDMLPLGVKQVLIHGTADGIVPYEISESYYKAAVAKGDDAQLVTLEGAGHFEVVDPTTKEWQKVVEAISGVLRR